MRHAPPALLLAMLLAACQLVAAPRFEVQLASLGEGIPPVDVVVIDHAGVVTGIERAPDHAWADGVSRGDAPGQVIVAWTGGVCDVRTTLSVTSDGDTLAIEEATETSDGGCLLVGVARSVLLELDRDIAPERFRLLRGP